MCTLCWFPDQSRSFPRSIFNRSATLTWITVSYVSATMTSTKEKKIASFVSRSVPDNRLFPLQFCHRVHHLEAKISITILSVSKQTWPQSLPSDPILSRSRLETNYELMKWSLKPYYSESRFLFLSNFFDIPHTKASNRLPNWCFTCYFWHTPVDPLIAEPSKNSNKLWLVT